MIDVKDAMLLLKQGGCQASLSGSTLSVVCPTWKLHTTVRETSEELFTVAYVKRWAASVKPLPLPEKKTAHGAAVLTYTDAVREKQKDYQQINLL